MWLANPTQQLDLVDILARVPNERRLAVAAAYLGLTVPEVYESAGLSAKIRHNFKAGNNGTPWEQGPAWNWSFRIAKAIGIAYTDLFEIDDDFDPVAAVPLVFDKRDGTGKRARRPSLLLVKSAS